MQEVNYREYILGKDLLVEDLYLCLIKVKLNAAFVALFKLLSYYLYSSIYSFLQSLTSRSVSRIVRVPLLVPR